MVIFYLRLAEILIQFYGTPSHFHKKMPLQTGGSTKKIKIYGTGPGAALSLTKFEQNLYIIQQTRAKPTTSGQNGDK